MLCEIQRNWLSELIHIAPTSQKVKRETAVQRRQIQLTYNGPRSHLWATCASINHKITRTHALRLREKIAIKRISAKRHTRKAQQVNSY